MFALCDPERCGVAAHRGNEGHGARCGQGRRAVTAITRDVGGGPNSVLRHRTMWHRQVPHCSDLRMMHDVSNTCSRWSSPRWSAYTWQVLQHAGKRNGRVAISGMLESPHGFSFCFWMAARLNMMVGARRLVVCRFNRTGWIQCVDFLFWGLEERGRRAWPWVFMWLSSINIVLYRFLLTRGWLERL